MKSLYDMHLQNQARMDIYNLRAVPAAYHDPIIEYKAVRENALLVDYSHMAIVSVIGDDAWAVVNHLASADIAIIRDEQGIYSLVLDDKGEIRGDLYALCTAEGYYLLSENIPADELVASLKAIALKTEELDIQEIPEICSMSEDEWGVIMIEGPYSWEIMAEAYGFDVIGLPYYEYMNADDRLMIFRCGKHGEFGYKLIGRQEDLVAAWQNLQQIGDKYHLMTGGLEYQRMVRMENTGWDEELYAKFSRNPVELQLQWAIQFDKEDFIGKEAVEALSQQHDGRKLVGILPTNPGDDIAEADTVLVEGQTVGTIVNVVYSPALQCFIALALIDAPYGYSDIDGYEIVTHSGVVPAKTHNLPFIYNLSMLVNPAEHSYIDESKAKNAL